MNDLIKDLLTTEQQLALSNRLYDKVEKAIDSLDVTQMHSLVEGQIKQCIDEFDFKSLIEDELGNSAYMEQIFENVRFYEIGQTVTNKLDNVIKEALNK